MALVKLPDALLEKLKCSVCDLYLSTAPVGIQPNGQAICSRCTDWSTPMPLSIVRCYLYEEMANLYAFPCRYQLWGCPQYMQFNEIGEHKSNCIYRTYSCPINSYSACNWKGSSFQLAEHYKHEHPELYLQELSFKFKVNADEEVHRLIKIDSVLLLLQTKCTIQENKMWFNTVYFGNVEDASLIQYNIKLRGEDKKRVIEFESDRPFPVTYIQLNPLEALEVDVSALQSLLKYPDYIDCSWVVTIPEELKIKLNCGKQRDEKELSCISNKAIKCPFCRIFMTAPIFRCAKNHITCINCKGIQDECQSCLSNHVEFSRANNLENLAESTRFSCKWENCYETFQHYNIREHELICSKRVYRCRLCGLWVGMLPEATEHFQLEHKIYCTLNSFFNLDLKEQSVYIFSNRQLINVKVKLLRYAEIKTYACVIYIFHSSKFPSFANYCKYDITHNKTNVKIEFEYSLILQRFKVIVSIPMQPLGTEECQNYFTVQSTFKKNTWIYFDYPFRSAQMEDI